jgi:TRAP-type uncharacterized transport system fused permease subunit
VFLIAVAIEGFLLTKVPALIRLLVLAGSFCLIDSGVTTDLIGLGTLAALAASQIIARNKEIKKK